MRASSSLDVLHSICTVVTKVTDAFLHAEPNSYTVNSIVIQLAGVNPLECL